MTNNTGHTFQPIRSDDRDAVAAFLVASEWPFHVYTTYTTERALEVVDDGFAWGATLEAHWMMQGDERVGIVRVFDLNDPTALLDLRIAGGARGRGLGKAMVRWITDHVFQNHATVTRVGGYTRIDNTPMRRVFEQCGYQKEAHYRRAWRDDNGPQHDTIGYGILRDEWASGTVMPVPWDA